MFLQRTTREKWILAWKLMSMPICSDEMRTMYGMRLDNCAKDNNEGKKVRRFQGGPQKWTRHWGETLILLQSLAFYSILAPPLLTPSPQNTVRVTNSTKRKISKCWKTAGSFRDPWPCWCTKFDIIENPPPLEYGQALEQQMCSTAFLGLKKNGGSFSNHGGKQKASTTWMYRTGS